MPSALLIHGITSSGTTWWRVGADLEDLGWTVRTPTLPGHGGARYPAGDDRPPLAVLADAVAADLDGRTVDLIVGHSLGALVALTLVGLHPAATRSVLLEDPPALNGGDPHDLVGDLPAETRAAQEDPEGAAARVLEDNPMWSVIDARESVANAASLDLDAAGRFLAAARWDLPALVAASPVPVHLLAAQDERSALQGAERQRLVAALGADRVTTVDSGHSIHRDRPGLWLETVLRTARGVA